MYPVRHGIPCGMVSRAASCRPPPLGRRRANRDATASSHRAFRGSGAFLPGGSVCARATQAYQDQFVFVAADSLLRLARQVCSLGTCGMGLAQSRLKCRRGAPSPGADVGRGSPAPVQMNHGVWDAMPCGIPCRAGCHAAWDAMPCGIPCRLGQTLEWMDLPMVGSAADTTTYFVYDVVRTRSLPPKGYVREC